MKTKCEYKDDDGRVVAKMNIDGMPWYTGAPKTEESKQPLEPLSKRETFKLILNSMLSALMVALIFGAVALAFILFCVFVWFK